MRRPHGQLLVFVGILSVALTLRSGATAVSPVLDLIRTDLDISNTELGVLGLLAPACFAVVGALTPGLGRRLGLERALVLSLVVSTVGAATRPLATEPVLLLALSAVTLSGMAMGNVLLPPLIKRWFPGRIGPVTGGYVVLLASGAALPPYLALPLSDAVGWRWALGSWALLSAAALVPWLILLRGLRADRAGGELDAGPRERVRVFASARAWGLTVMFFSTALSVYSLFAWLPEILIDAGVSTGSAGSLLGLYAALGIPPSLILPPLATRMRNPYPLLLAFVGMFMAGYAGLLLAPATLTWVWVVLAGLGPGTFPMTLTLINLRTETTAGASDLSGMVQGVGYGLAGGGPLLVGLLHDLTGDWTASILLLAVTAASGAVGGWYGCQPGTVEAELAERTRPRTAEPVGTPRPPS